MSEHRLLRNHLEHTVADPLRDTFASAQELEQIVADLLLGESNPHPLPITL